MDKLELVDVISKKRFEADIIAIVYNKSKKKI